MAEKKTKVKRKDLRKQRWASIIAAVLALAMIFSGVAAYAVYLLDRRNDDTVNPDQQIDLEAAQEYYLGEVERLQKYIDDYGPTAPVLNELVQNYAFLIQIEKMDNQASEEKLQGYRDNLKKFSRALVELEPDNPEHRLQLLYAYEEVGEDEAVVTGEITALRKLLHENPDPSSSLMLIGFLKSSSQQEEILNDEIAWLKKYLEQLDASGKLDSENRYCYAYLLGEYLEETEAAEEQLALILEKEPEGSPVHNAAKTYLEKLQQNEAGEK